MLPYMRKTFQTSMEEAFGVSGSELGTLNSMFGVLAVLCYFPGGWLADRFPARHLLTISLVSTGLGGFYMLSFPGYTGLLALHAFWGVTSILTFWAALIKATREWGGPREQGRGFGLLDGGRGVTAALLATLATYVFTRTDTTVHGLRNVLWVYSLAPLLAGAAVWLVVPTRHPSDPRGPASASEQPANGGSADRPGTTSNLKEAAGHVEVWLLAIVILASYWLYVGSFGFPAYVERVYGESKTFGAVLGTFRDWMRPVAAVGAGVLADRLRSSWVIGAVSRRTSSPSFSRHGSWDRATATDTVPTSACSRSSPWSGSRRRRSSRYGERLAGRTRQEPDVSCTSSWAASQALDCWSWYAATAPWWKIRAHAARRGSAWSRASERSSNGSCPPRRRSPVAGGSRPKGRSAAPRNESVGCAGPRGLLEHRWGAAPRNYVRITMPRDHPPYPGYTVRPRCRIHRFLPTHRPIQQ